VVLCGRDEEHDLILEGARTYLGTGGTVLNVLDLETGRRRPTTLEDLKNLARLTDALENVHFYMLPVYPTELDPPEVDVNRFWGALTNTAKHVMGGVYSLQGVREVIGIASAISGGREQLRERPIISMVTCVMSPLVMEETYTDLLIEVARQGIPLVCPAEPMAGATAPCTLAATVALSNAETLGGVVLAQLANPGTPVIYGTVATAMDMKTGSYLSGNIESGLINAASAQMAQFYRLPIYATAGMSDSKIPDIQAGYEKAATALLTALAGANFIHDAAGFLEFCTTISYEQMVIDDEIIGMCMRAVRGIEVNEETLAEEVIRRVGPGGNFLTEEHTLKHFKGEFFYPRISDRQNRKIWEKQGAKDAADRARERAAKLLKKHQPLPVAPEIAARVRTLYPALK
ncbi:MAG: trimethylamine methyltransferase family protein, partial [Bacillota bacterium]